MIVTDEKLLKTFRMKERCEWCHKSVFRCEPHHVFARGMGGGGRLDVAINLIGLCPDCHRDHHQGRTPQKFDLLAVVAAREGRLQIDIESEIAQLRRKRGRK